MTLTGPCSGISQIHRVDNTFLLHSRSKPLPDPTLSRNQIQLTTSLRQRTLYTLLHATRTHTTERSINQMLSLPLVSDRATESHQEPVCHSAIPAHTVTPELSKNQLNPAYAPLPRKTDPDYVTCGTSVPCMFWAGAPSGRWSASGGTPASRGVSGLMTQTGAALQDSMLRKVK